ncbi:MAG TPA: glycerol-3-phosphate acyltransferase [Candidatus Angelobacter sp.]|jgi:glycerol-3-phosphate acyltransferase PlsY|nr:glycerol-3-phosphate acyltransferase [Candidatus Angelobacter sp.]
MVSAIVAQNTWTVAATGALAYLIGSVPVGWLLARMRGVEVRSLGSGNVGTSNIYRNVDTGLAVVVGPTQFVQGLLPVLAARALGFDSGVLVLTALCAVIGNGWPIWLGFNGGRGIAVATGAVAALNPWLLLALVACYAVGAVLHEIAEGVLGGFLLLPLVGALVAGAAIALGCVGLLMLVLMRRLEGVTTDVRRYGHPWRLVTMRLVRDQRPGRPLVGRRTDA